MNERLTSSFGNLFPARYQLYFIDNYVRPKSQQPKGMASQEKTQISIITRKTSDRVQFLEFLSFFPLTNISQLPLVSWIMRSIFNVNRKN